MTSSFLQDLGNIIISVSTGLGEASVHLLEIWQTEHSHGQAYFKHFQFPLMLELEKEGDPLQVLTYKAGKILT